MGEGKSSLFGQLEYEAFQSRYKALYDQVFISNNLLVQLNEIEDEIKSLEGQREQEGYLANSWIDKARGKLLYLETIVFKRTELLSNKGM